jgi:hypothetical protein
VRGFLLGALLLLFVTFTVLSLRPGGLRRQLHFAARRLRLALVLGGAYLAGSTVIRLEFPTGYLADWGPPALALTLVAVFMVLGQDPADAKP